MWEVAADLLSLRVVTRSIYRRQSSYTEQPLFNKVSLLGTRLDKPVQFWRTKLQISSLFYHQLNTCKCQCKSKLSNSGSWYLSPHWAEQSYWQKAILKAVCSLIFLIPSKYGLNWLVKVLYWKINVSLCQRSLPNNYNIIVCWTNFGLRQSFTFLIILLKSSIK